MSPAGAGGRPTARVVVLGASGSFPGVDEPCSGYVVESGGARVVVDLGWGTVSRLFALLGNHTGDGLHGVFVTHDHPDHMGDLYALFRARWFGRRAADPLPLFAPAGVVARLVDQHDGAAQDIHRVFAWQETPGPDTSCGPFSVHTVLLPHYVPNAGLRLSTADVAVAFTGDTGASTELAELGRDTDIFVVDATDRHQQPGVEPAPAGQPPLNLTAGEAGAAAAAAGARVLLLTHLWPGNDHERARDDAAGHYPGPVLVAHAGLVVDVQPTRHDE